jgi:hypothetical protein
VPRYLVERTFATGFPIDPTDTGRAECGRIAAGNAELGVTWLLSYVAEDGRTSFCICDAPSPEAVRRAAGRNHWPVDAISQVTVLDPHFHLGTHPRRRRE